MPLSLTPDQLQRLRDRRDKGELSAPQLEALSLYEQTLPQVPQLVPPPVPPPPVPDTSATVPWWQRALETQGERGTLTVPGTEQPAAVPTAPTSGERTDIDVTMGQQARRAAAEGISLAPALFSGWGTPATASRLPGFWPWAYQNLYLPGRHALREGLLQYGADLVAQQVAPEGQFDPARGAAYTAAGDFLGGRVVPTVKGLTNLARQPWAETPMGTVHREVIENLGGEAPLSVVSERYLPRMTTQGLKHSPMGYRLRQSEEAALKVVNDEMERLRGTYPGGEVSSQQARLGSRVESLARPALLEDLPTDLRTQLQKVGPIAEDLATQAFKDLDSNYLNRLVNRFPGRKKHYAPEMDALLLDPSLVTKLGLDPMGPNIFGETSRLLKAMDTLPNDITVASALDLHKEVWKRLKEIEAVLAAGPRTGDAALLHPSLQTLVMPALADSMNELNFMLRPYLVDIGPAQEQARRLLAGWQEGLQVPEALTQGQQASGVIQATMDPDVMGALTYLEKPQFVTFLEAHQMRSQWKKIGRLPSLVIGDTVAKRANAVADVVDGQMEYVAKGLYPQLLPQWRLANEVYAKLADTWNSRYVTEVLGKDLDDLLTTLVQPERPNDLKTLRQVLQTGGGDVSMDDVAQLWLTRKIMQQTEQGTQPLTAKGANALLGELNQLTTRSERELFPAGLTGMRQRLRQMVDMDRAVTEVGKGLDADVTELRRLKTDINDPLLWRSVQGDVLHRMFRERGDLVSGETLLNILNDMKSVRDVVFSPGHVRDLMRLGHTARALEEASRERHQYWSPIVQVLGHGAIISTAAYMTQDWKTPVALGVLAPGMSYLLTRPDVVRLLTAAMRTPVTAPSAGYLTGALMGHLGEIQQRDPEAIVSGAMPGP